MSKIATSTACLHGEPACRECAPHLGHPKQFDWRAEAALALEVRRPHDNRVLRVVVTSSRGQWLVISLEAPLDATEVEAVFGDHAHKVVGTYDEMLRAVEAAEGFSRCWLGGSSSTKFRKKCECKKIT